MDLRLAPGEQVALLGPNGAGKTTLLRAALGLLAPSSGWSRLHGFDLADPAGRLSALRRTGATIEQPGLPLQASPLAYLGWWARLHALDAPLERSRELLSAWGLPADGAAERLSQGQRQILQILRCLVPEPSLLVLDEPTSFLDPDTRARFEDGIRQWRARTGGAVLVSTHHLDAVGDADRVVLLAAGRIRREGAPEALLGTGEFSRLLRLDPAGDPALAEQALREAGPYVRAWRAGTVRGCPAWRVACPDGEAGHAALLETLVRGGAGVRSLDRDETTLREFWDAAVASPPLPPAPPAPAPPGAAPTAGGASSSEAFRTTARFQLALVARERRLLLPVLVLEAFLLGSVALATAGSPAGPAPSEALSLLLLAGLLPMGLSASLAADSIAGERERRSLETLLCAPIRPLPLFLGKGLAAWLPGQFLSWLGFWAAALLLSGREGSPSPALQAALGLVVVPSMGLASVAAALAASRRARTVRAAAQLAALALLPLLAAAQVLPRLLETPGGSSISGWLVVAAVCSLVAAALAARSWRSLESSRLALRS